ncbi:family 43 glycosylhydrolase [Catellatospora coxensis]
MRRSGRLAALTAVAVAAIVASLGVAVLPAHAAPVTVTNGTQFTDTSGNVVHAHGGGVLKVGAYYYWFGESRNANNTFKAVAVYRSTDLRNWEFRNNVLTQSSAAELNVANIERPKVIYNASTGKYVMWMHKENGSDYGEARAAVAVGDTVDGAYTYQGSFRPLGHMSRDITIYNDNGTAYMISAADENRDLHIYRLTADYLGIQSLVGNFWNDAARGARAVQAGQHLLPDHLGADRLVAEPGQVRDRVEHHRPVERLDERRRLDDVPVAVDVRADDPGHGDDQLPVHG